MSANPFAAPAPPGDGIKFTDLLGSLLLVEVTGVEDHVPTVHTKPGEKSPAVRADVVVLDGDQKGETYMDTLIFPKVLQGQLKARVGQKVLGRLSQGQAKPGQSPPWKLDEATAADIQVGQQFLASQMSSPAQPDQSGDVPF